MDSTLNQCLLKSLEDDASELVLANRALVEWVEVLEIFLVSQSIDLSGPLNIPEDSFDILGDRWPFPCAFPWHVLDLGHVGEVIGFSVIEEVKVSDFLTVISCVQFANRFVLLSCQFEAQCGEHLPELLRRDFQSVEFVPVFEELFGLETVRQPELYKLFFDLLGECPLFLSDLWPSFSKVSPRSEGDVEELLVNIFNEIAVADEISGFHSILVDE